MSNALWTEKYRPQDMENYVFKNPAFKEKMDEWIRTGDIPHIGFFGPAGTGKTSAIGVLINGLEKNGHIDRFDVMVLNMSDEGIDAVREKIDQAARLAPNGKYRIFVLEEMEQMHQKAQGSLKRTMEDYAENARFILTSNEPHKILKPILSRVQTIMIEKHDREAYMTRVINILLAENVDLSTDESIELVEKYINATYPDFRKTLNTLQSSIVDGKLLKLEDSIDSTANYRSLIIDALKNNNIREMRELIVQNIPEDEMDGFFTYLSQNVKMFSDDEITRMKIIVKIRDAMVKQASVSDRELNLSALLCEIDLICTGNW
ncbi:clamp loader subunit [Salmonella phage SE_PL]|nr:clamp loader [Salmonella phage Munch]EAZ2022651.1 AAA family ATPase [Salmonella enterica]ECV9083785.1 AAA family ATPase [Salmonella enterica subsp. enterica serovar Infantis]MCP0435624.1 AAA family ATPase [Salmonella enterica subsp. enterica serovar Mbandaka]QCW19054.1 clamp loader subunit [Salmonella phage 7t3]QIG62683.1 clamp loader subunit [Salmonella phage SE_PL]WNV47464.1 clamp loader [Klebsiella phage fENko-Kae01]